MDKRGGTHGKENSLGALLPSFRRSVQGSELSPVEFLQLGRTLLSGRRRRAPSNIPRCHTDRDALTDWGPISPALQRPSACSVAPLQPLSSQFANACFELNSVLCTTSLSPPCNDSVKQSHPGSPRPRARRKLFQSHRARVIQVLRQCVQTHGQNFLRLRRLAQTECRAAPPHSSTWNGDGTN